MSVFSILNIPPKMKKEEVFQNLELINLQYNRLYKRGFYWVISTLEKETVICIQNSLRTLSFDDMKCKYDLKHSNQIWKIIKEQIDKITYQKEAKYLGIGSKNNNINNNRHKSSNDNSDALSWRKGSGEGSSFDYNEKHYKKDYYHNNNKYYKRNRFNSDNAVSYKQKENNEYKPQLNQNQNIEIDISNLKYPVIIKNKYSFKDIEKYYHNLMEKNVLSNLTPFDKDKMNIFRELVSEKPKELVSLKELIDSSSKMEKSENQAKNNEINSNIKIPKTNPLSNMNKIPFHGKNK